MTEKKNGKTGSGKTKKLLIWLVAGVLLVGVLAVFGISGYVGWNLTHPARQPVDQNPGQMGLTYRDITFTSREDGLELKGWLIPAGNDRPTVIVAHGYRKNRLQDDVPALPVAAWLAGKGYNVLMFDFRNSGESAGTMTSVGQHEVRDLLGAIDFIRQQNSQQVILLGYSMGAVTSIMAAARSPEVAAVIADSPFADLRRYLNANLSVWTDLPSFPFNPAFMLVVPPLTGLNPDAVSPVRDIPLLGNRPVLLIHGDADRDIPLANSEELAAAYANTTLAVFPGATHVKSYASDPAAYLQVLADFLDGVTGSP